jgi:GNAT superfamily N-acetyltransferase
MDKAQILALYDQDQRIDVVYPDTRREVVYDVDPGAVYLTPRLVRQVALDERGDGSIIYTRLDETDVDVVIREQVAYFDALGQDFEWKVYNHDTPFDLADRLAVHGFEVEEPEAIMVLDVDETPQVLLEPVSHVVRPVIRPDEIDQVMAVEAAVWGEHDASLESYLRRTLANYSERMSIYLATVDGRPVSAAWIYFPPDSQFASLWGGSTLGEYRGRGLYTALVAVRLQEARRRGISYLTVDASPMSRPILERFGFECIAYASPCKWRRNK